MCCKCHTINVVNERDLKINVSAERCSPERQCGLRVERERFCARARVSKNGIIENNYASVVPRGNEEKQTATQIALYITCVS